MITIESEERSTAGDLLVFQLQNLFLGIRVVLYSCFEFSNQEAQVISLDGVVGNVLVWNVVRRHFDFGQSSGWVETDWKYVYFQWGIVITRWRKQPQIHLGLGVFHWNNLNIAKSLQQCFFSLLWMNNSTIQYGRKKSWFKLVYLEVGSHFAICCCRLWSVRFSEL